MTPDQVAEARQARLSRISDTAVGRSLSLWQRMQVDDLDGSWASLGPKIAEQTVAAQLTAARASDRFTGAMSSAWDFSQDSSRIVPEAFAGVDGSGRSVEGLLFGSVTTTKEAIRQGLSLAQAMQAGATYLAAMAKTAMADLSRSSDMVSATGKGYTHYVRVVEPGACSRCVVLAGAEQFKPFKRHPACKCHVEPVPHSDWASSEKYSPYGVFDSMTEAEQDGAFGRAGAQAIRDGADISQVVSARRGAKGIGYSYREGTTPNSGYRMQKTTIGYRPDGTPIQVYTTSEGTTRRGRFGRSQERILDVQSQRVGSNRYATTNRIRLMPESIYEIADGDQAVAKLLLRDAGYLDYDPRLTAAQKAAAMASDRAYADRVLASHGIRLS